MPKTPDLQPKKQQREAGMGAPGKARQQGLRKGGQGKQQAGKRKAVRAAFPAGAVTMPNLPLIYLNVPKSACTTIKNMMFFMEHGHWVEEPLDIHSDERLQRSRDRTPESLAMFNGKLAQRHLVFTFVRHPGKRVYSCFSEKIAHQSKYSFPKIRDYIARHHGLKLPEPGDTSYDLARHRANFNCFLDFVEANFAGKTDVRVDAHWGRQSAALENFQRFFMIDFIGRVESFESQFRFILDQFPPPHMPDLSTHFNEGPKPPFSYEQIVDEAIEARLHRLYSDDYRLFGYGA